MMMEGQPPMMVVGYGNTLRRDDGLGVRVAEAFAELRLPGVEVVIRHQLVPELAETVAKASCVVFVDASSCGGDKPELVRMKPSNSNGVFAHASDPASILALAAQLYNGHPEAWSLNMPAHDFGFGEEISPEGMKGLYPAIEYLRRLASAVTRDG